MSNVRNITRAPLVLPAVLWTGDNVSEVVGALGNIPGVGQCAVNAYPTADGQLVVDFQAPEHTTDPVGKTITVDQDRLVYRIPVGCWIYILQRQDGVHFDLGWQSNLADSGDIVVIGDPYPDPAPTGDDGTSLPADPPVE